MCSILRLDIKLMSDLSSYRTRVADYGKQATEAEKAENYEQAYRCYMEALELFMHMIKCKFCCQLILLRKDEKNTQLVTIYK